MKYTKENLNFIDLIGLIWTEIARNLPKIPHLSLVVKFFYYIFYKKFDKLNEI